MTTTTRIPKQKFKKGDVVRIAKDLGPSANHFKKDCEAIVQYSYHEKYGGEVRNGHDYGLQFPDGDTVSWYHEGNLKFVRRVRKGEVAKILRDEKAREKKESDLTWIVSNWPKIRLKVPGAVIGKLFQLLGIRDPWLTTGEGSDYHASAMATHRLVDPILKTGSLKKVKAFFTVFRKLRNLPPLPELK